MVLGRRDPTPIEPLFRAHFDAIYRYARLRVGSDAALDVAAETFHQALRKVGTLDPERDARPWLFGIATNVLRHHRRQEARKLRAYARAASGERDHSRLGPDESDPASRGLLVDALMELEPRDRETLLLLAWGELSYDEIADALAIPVGTVRSRINRARRLVRTTLTADNDAPGHALAGAKGEVTWTS